jgi:hypothetical protein
MMFQNTLKVARAIWRILFHGIFAMLPGVFFTAIPIGFFYQIGNEHLLNHPALFLYGGACGGLWMGKKLILNDIEKIEESSSKWDIYNKVKEN